MKQVTNNFKNDIKTYGRQFNFKVQINDVDASEDDINYIKPSFNSKLFQTIMHKLEIDSKNEIPLKSKIKVSAGIKVNEPEYEYISYSTYSVNSCERQEDTNSYVSIAYDKMIESMIDYDLNITEKITLREYLIKICERLSWNTNNIPATFINSDKLVEPILHADIDYTFRDALDEIATISCSFLLFKGEDFYLVYPTETNENIDNEYLNEDNVTIGEKYFINSLVFSRAEESDNIYRKDDANIESNGLHEYKISENQLLSTNDRDLYIDEMWEYLKTFEFYIYDVSSKGILFLEACDRFNFVLSGNTYSTILLNNEIAFEDGLSEDLYIDKPEETETEYKYADTTDKKINKTNLIVDKQNQLIQSIIEVTDSLDNNIDLLNADLQKQLQDLSISLEEYMATVSTQFKQTETDFNFLFNQVVEKINANAEGNSEKIVEITKYIRFEDGNILLGKSDNQLILKIQNDRISYQQNGSEVAYFSNNKLYVTTLEVTHSLQLGNFAFIPRANGNLSFKKVGGN